MTKETRIIIDEPFSDSTVLQTPTEFKKPIDTSDVVYGTMTIQGRAINKSKH